MKKQESPTTTTIPTGDGLSDKDREVLERIGTSAWGKVLEIDRENWLKVVQKPCATTLAYYKRKNKKRKIARLKECRVN